MVKSNHYSKLQKFHKQIHVKNAAFAIVTFGSKWICLFSEVREIIFKDAHGIGFMAFFSKTLKK